MYISNHFGTGIKLTTLYIEVHFKTKSPDAFQNVVEMRLTSF